MNFNDDQYYQAYKSRDARFDGAFFIGVSTTGIYCRPVCPARTPGRDRCSFFRNAASAEAAGFRPCLRCRPELAPGEAPVDSQQRLARAAVTRIAERIGAGALDRGSVAELAAGFGLSARQLHRILKTEYGVGPHRLAQTRRLLLAKQLLTDTALPVVDVAFASGFSSLRQFNRVFLDSYRLNPSALRKNRPLSPDKVVTLTLGYRPPLAWEALTGFLVSRSDGMSQGLFGQHYVRTLKTCAGSGWIAARPEAGNRLGVEVSSSLLLSLPELQPLLRQLFDLDANPRVIDEHLSTDLALSPLVQRQPGLRIPGSVDGFELALRAILGQQISVKAATTLFRRMVEAFGEPVVTPFPGINRLPPDPQTIAGLPQQALLDLGITRRRADTIIGLARVMAAGELILSPTVDPELCRRQLLALPGIGPWTADYVAMRALADPDAFPQADLGLLRGMRAENPAQLEALSQRWRPWRAYAAFHIWHALGQGG